MGFEILKPGIPRIRGVLFDMDGLVLDTEKLYTRFWAEACGFYGFSMTREQALRMRAANSRLSEANLHEFFGPGADYRLIRAKRIELMNAHIAEYGVEAKPGIYELLDYLHGEGIPCAITSSSSVPLIREHLGNLGLLDYFTALCSGKDVPKGKPAPDIYLHGAATIGVAPENCLAIEDSPAGIEAAWRAGCMAVIVPDQDQPGEEVLSRSFAKADSLFDVMELL